MHKAVVHNRHLHCQRRREPEYTSEGSLGCPTGFSGFYIPSVCYHFCIGRQMQSAGFKKHYAVLEYADVTKDKQDIQTERKGLFTYSKALWAKVKWGNVKHFWTTLEKHRC